MLDNWQVCCVFFSLKEHKLSHVASLALCPLPSPQTPSFVMLNTLVSLQLRLNSHGHIIGTEYLSDLVEKEHAAHNHGKPLPKLFINECWFSCISYRIFIIWLLAQVWYTPVTGFSRWGYLFTSTILSDHCIVFPNIIIIDSLCTCGNDDHIVIHRWIFLG